MFNGKIFLSFLFLCSVAFISCNSTTKSTPKGEFKKIDLRKTLPADIASTPDAQAQEYSKEITVGEPAAKVLLKWRTLKKENNNYILSVTIDVPQDTQGIQLTDASVKDPINTGNVDSVVQTNIVLISWDSSKAGATSAGVYSGTIKATGEFAPL